MASQAGTFNVQEFADAGIPLVNGRLYTYAYGTTTQKTAYTDAAGTIAHTYTADGTGGQYIALNSRGELPAPLYLTTGSYDLSLKRADGSSVWTRRADGQAVESDFSASSGSSLVGFIASGTGAVARTLQDKDRDIVSVKDYGATGNGATDDTAFIQAAINAVSTGGALYFPPGTYKVSAALTIPGSYVRILGGGNAVLQTNSASANIFTVTGNYVTMVGLQFTSSATRTAGYFVEFRASSFSRLYDFLMTGAATGVGITGAGATGVHIYNGSITGIPTAGNGIVIGGTGNTSDIVIRDMWIVGASSVVANQPTSGVNIANGGDITLDHVSTVYAGAGLLVSPAASQTVQLLTVNQCEFDTGTTGIYLNASANGAAIQAVRISSTWACTNSSNGVLLTSTGTGAVQDVSIDNSILSNNTGYGVLINTTNVFNIRVSGGTSMSANTTAGFGTAVGASRFQVHGCTLGACGQFAGNPYGIAIGNNCDNFEITDNDLSNNTTGAMFNAASVTLPGTPGQTYHIARNLGLVTYQAGTVTLTAAAVTTTITHGLVATPRIQDITITPRSGWGTAGTWSINNPTATTFDIVTNANPGAGVLFAWQARLWGA